MLLSLQIMAKSQYQEEMLINQLKLLLLIQAWELIKQIKINYSQLSEN